MLYGYGNSQSGSGVGGWKMVRGCVLFGRRLGELDLL